MYLPFKKSVTIVQCLHIHPCASTAQYTIGAGSAQKNTLVLAMPSPTVYRLPAYYGPSACSPDCNAVAQAEASSTITNIALLIHYPINVI